jgi:Fe-S oxidoreductase
MWVFSDYITADFPLIGIEPSAILTFRDEYIRLADDTESAKKLAKNVFTISKMRLQKVKFMQNNFLRRKTIKIHGHCHQKSLSTMEATFAMLNVPKNSSVTIYNSGCCGMAGSLDMKRTL